MTRATARVSVEQAVAWIDGATQRLGPEDVVLDAALRRISDRDLRAGEPIPCADCAAVDGFAVVAAASLGATPYNPLAVAAVAIRAGEALPPETDAVVPSDQARSDEWGRIELIEPVAPGAYIERRGAVAAAGAPLVAAGTCLAPRHLGLLGLAGIARLPVVRQPRIRLVITGQAGPEQAVASNRAMLRGLVARDGGIVLDAALSDAFAPGCELIVIVGGSGASEDPLAAAIAAAGSLEINGVALIPGESAALGRTADGTPALLLPGAPAACLWNYELFAGRAIRRLGGRDPALPHRRCRVTTARKIASPIGMTEICPVQRLADGRVEPVAPFAEVGLRAAVAADGFVIVPAPSEGCPAGAVVKAYFYGRGKTQAEPAL